MGYIRCAREVTQDMKTNGWGRIINISGLAARSTGNTVGSIRNVALSALSKNMADELGPSGINVNVVHPGYTRTERTPATVQKKALEQGVSVEEIEIQMASRNSIRHVVEAAEVADVVVFLCSSRSRAINGDSIAVGGGMPNSIHY
jgi:NAD(P)-dependent dehydrogenase (short-subunit alcohol dehydrogenase family)